MSSTAVVKVGRLKPEVRLGQAISEFQADLSTLQKASFRAHQMTATPPGIRDVMQLTAEINRSSGLHGRCFGPRLTNVLQSVQQFAALGDVVVGGTQNMLACGVWSLVRMALLSIVNYSAYFDRLSSMLMAVGRSAPRYQLMGAIYPKSERLGSCMLEYFIIIVQLCHHVLRLSQKSAFGQWASTLTDSLITYQTDLDLWATSIKEEVNLLMAQHMSLESEENSWFRSRVTRHNESQSHTRILKTRKRVLDACSMYDHERDWKQIRKLGSTTLLKTSTAYSTWKEQRAPATNDSRTLLCTGKLGSGKSVVLANIVDDLNLEAQKTTTVAYFFCQHDATESLNARTVIGSLARQLLHSNTDFDRVNDILNESSSLNTQHVLYLLKAMLSASFKAYFILDGLMHCDADERGVILSTLRALQDMVSLSLCISLRLVPSDSVQGLEQLLDVTMFPIMDHNPDIDDFINAELQICIESGKLAVHEPLLVLEIQEALSRGAQGMFLWVALQIKALCLERTDADIRNALANLPSDLSIMYDFILQKSRPVSAEYQMKILELAITACRPLTTEEMREALSVIPGHAFWDPQNLLNDITATLACCGGLLTIDEEDLSVRMIHHSVRTFLGQHRSVEHAHHTMAEIIVTYLNYRDFSKQLSTLKMPQIRADSVTDSVISTTANSLGQSRRLALKLLRFKKGTDTDIGQILVEAAGHSKKDIWTSFTFYHYATSWWQEHIFHLDLDRPGMKLLLVDLLQIHNPNKADLHSRTPLSHASERGYNAMAELLLEHGALHTPDSLQKTPLHWAVEAGHASVVTSLLSSKGVQPNAQDKWRQTPLLLATKAKKKAVLETLLYRPRMVLNLRDIDGRTPLRIAQTDNFIDGFKILLRYFGVEQKDIDPKGNTPLHVAAEHGNAETVEILVLLAAVELNCRNSEGRTPLWLAAANGHVNIVRTLANDQNPDHDLPDDDQETPFWIAAANGHQPIVEYLARSGHVNVNHKNKLGYAAFWMAARNGHAPVVKLLATYQSQSVNEGNEQAETPLWIGVPRDHQVTLRMLAAAKGVVPIHKDICALAPLWVAIFYGHADVVKVLAVLEGIYHSYIYAHGGTLLWTAASLGHRDVTKVLVAIKGVNLNYVCSGVTPLMRAASLGHEGVTKVLAAIKAVNVNSVGNNSGVTPLWRAASLGHEGVTKILAATGGVDINYQGLNGATPLWVAASEGHEDVVKVLTAIKHVNLNHPDACSRTPLWIAASQGHEGVVKVLTAIKHVNLNHPDACGRTPLWIAGSLGYKDIVKVLAATKGININYEDSKEATPLWVASRNGQTEIVDFLVHQPHVDVNAANKSRATPVAIAATQGHADIVSILASSPGVSLNLTDKAGETPLWKAARKGHAEVVKVLIGFAQVEVNCTQTEDLVSLTPLLAALYGGRLSVVRALLECPRVNLSIPGVESPLKVAENIGYDSIADLLRKRISASSSPS